MKKRNGVASGVVAYPAAANGVSGENNGIENGIKWRRRRKEEIISAKSGIAASGMVAKSNGGMVKIIMAGGISENKINGVKMSGNKRNGKINGSEMA